MEEKDGDLKFAMNAGMNELSICVITFQKVWGALIRVGALIRDYTVVLAWPGSI